MKINEYPLGAVTDSESLVIGDTLYFWCPTLSIQHLFTPRLGRLHLMVLGIRASSLPNNIRLGQYEGEYPEFALTRRTELVCGSRLYFVVYSDSRAYGPCGHPEIGSAVYKAFSVHNSSSISFNTGNGLTLDGEMTYTWVNIRGFFFTNYFHALAFVLQGKHKISRRT